MNEKRKYHDYNALAGQTYGKEAHETLKDWSNLMGYWLHDLKEDMERKDYLAASIHAKMLAQAREYVKKWRDEANILDRTR